MRPRREIVRRLSSTSLVLAGLCAVLFLSTLLLELKFYTRTGVALHHQQISRTGTPDTESKPDPVTSIISAQTSATLVPPHAQSSPTLQQSTMTNPAIVLFCYNRSDYLTKTLESLSRLEGLSKMSVYISQDGYDQGVHNISWSFGLGALAPPRTQGFAHWQRERKPLLHTNQPGHAWLAQHYKWGLDKVFLDHGHSHVIIVEDDMLFSPDFLTYFEATAPLLEEDPSLWCISTWNDNGLSYFDWDHKRLFRTSYFPGLGWMMRRQLWMELGPKFPKQAWDHWMRLDGTSQGRECVCPEVNRNANIGEVGANMQKSMFKRHFKAMAWHTDKSLSAEGFGDLSYLGEAAYTAHMRMLLSKAQLWEGPVNQGRVQQLPRGQVHLLLYKGEAYAGIARSFKIWPFPRGHHNHIIALPYRGSTWLLADVRFCPLLAPQQRVLPHPQLRPIAASNVSISCTTTCREEGLKCSVEDFWFINTCEELAKHFACSAGCAVELGPDVPNYVVDPQLATYQTCLVTQQSPRCSASHRSTQRLCPCV